MGERRRAALEVGDEFVVDLVRIAHGGHVIAHHEGWTVFVRHGLPGETVRVRVTEVTRKIARADVLEVLVPALGRTTPPCRWSGPSGCGGCDFQHVDPAHQRELKTEVLMTSLLRFAGLDPADPVLAGARVQELPGHEDGLGWMSRVRWARDRQGQVGLRAHRSHDVVPVDTCLIAASAVAKPSSSRPEAAWREVRHRRWQMPPGAFWQVHPALPEALVSTVLEFGGPVTGEHWWDLYAGAGLFAAFLAEAVGPAGEVTAVEQDPAGVAAAREALADLPAVRIREADATAWVETAARSPLSGVVLDPPRSGAGASVMGGLAARGPTRIVYIACDPVALARDVRAAGESGYRLTRLRAFDAFPMTHHFETVALLERGIDQEQPDLGHALS